MHKDLVITLATHSAILETASMVTVADSTTDLEAAAVEEVEVLINFIFLISH